MLSPGSVIEGKYRIVKVIGTGGMSTVYLAMHEQLHEKRAVKEIRYGGDNLQELEWQRLIAEIHILKKLKHPSLPTIMDVIQKGKNILVVMEYIEGITLQEKIQKEGVMSEKEGRAVARQLVGVLRYLHNREPPVVHRDIKPSNLMLREDGSLVLLDFGTAREGRGGRSRDTICLGTRGYAAPEQYRSDAQTDERTDIYCVGTTLYHLLTGKSPAEPPYKMYSIRRWNSQLSEGFEKIILKCTRENPKERYQNCDVLLADLMQLEKKEELMSRVYRKRKKYFPIILAFFLICILFGSLEKRYEKVCRNREAKKYVYMAEKALEPEKIAENYKKALQADPANRTIYESLTESLIQPEKFSVTKAVFMMNILDESERGKPVLEIFRQEDGVGYGEFCYRVGVGYFYDMGEIHGKKEAGTWFESAAEEKMISKEMRRRAKLYAKISQYYKTFIGNATVRDGEENGYQEFYETLHELNQIVVEEKSKASELAAAYQISQEVAVEIGNYALDFLRKTSVGYADLLGELNHILYAENSSKSRIEYLSAYYDKENIDQLVEMVEDARERVQIAGKQNRRGENEDAEQGEKEIIAEKEGAE